jgi:diamine N-acetyltransferase
MTDETLPPEQPIINFSGEKVSLGPPRRDLLPLYLRWINDFEVSRTLMGWQPMTMEAEEDWYNEVARSQSHRLFTVYEKESLRPVGGVGLHDINLRHSTAEMGLMIGEKSCWGKGYGTEATRLMLDYGFNGLSLHNIMLRVHSHNERGIRAYRRAGFKEIGRQREAFRLGGRAWDVIYMDCLAHEFEGSVLQQLLPSE